ncbi:MAG TPA: hypothetical protein VL970_06035 [Candidatus Acidoferrales bacterium]|nr:hypothetical protein [Candidatus Acidoferrales bacterium]
MAKWTTNPWQRRWWQACGLAWLPLVLGAVPLRAAEPASPAAAVQSGTVAALEYAETPYSVNSVGVSLTQQTAPFKKEPAAGKTAVRGTLNFGGAGNTVAFLWRRDDGKLFLDLNQNLDLTDDPAGVFSKSSPGAFNAFNYQTFTNIHLTLRTPSGAYPVLADLHFWDFSSRPSCTAEVHSWWGGKVTLSSQEWQVGIIPSLSQFADSCDGGGLLLRPWERRSEAFSVNGNSLDALEFSRNVFAGGHAYELHWLPKRADAQLKPALEFVEKSVPLGDLKISGQFIRRLVLRGGAYLVICDSPSETVKAPTGNYYLPDVLLEQKGVQAFCNSAAWRTQRTVKVADHTLANLVAGGPLTNTVSAARHGEDLTMNYQLMGAGGQIYQMMNLDRSKPPEFAIYKGQRKVAAGNFEFG